VPCVPVIVTVVAEFTGVVETINVAVVAPAGTVTEPVTVALALFDDRLTTVPLGPAGPFRVTVPLDVLPPTTEVGERVTLIREAALTVSVAV